jgi:hypothetical protein
MLYLTICYCLLVCCIFSGRRTHRSGRVAAQPVTDPVVHGEGPHWDHERGLLYFVDISSSMVLVLNDSASVLTRIPVAGGQPVSLVIPVKGITIIYNNHTIFYSTVNPCIHDGNHIAELGVHNKQNINR